MNTRLLAGLLALLSMISPLAASGLDQHLVARWSFNDQSMKSDRGNYTLVKRDAGRQATLELVDGAARLGPGALLVCDALDSRRHPGLRTAVTLWARVWMDTPAERDAFLFGLRAKTQPGDWGDMVLVAMARPQPPGASGFFATLGAGGRLASGSRVLPVAPGRFVSMALVFDASSKSITYVVDGKTVISGDREAVDLADFNNFAIGRLKEAGGVGITVDEVRVYSIALSPEWIADIQPL